jgi:hypothetical protein
MKMLTELRGWHRPSTVFAGVMAVLAVVSIGGLIFDDRMLTGVPIWQKPFKFAISMTIYALTWAWMTSLLPKGKRLAGHLATALAMLLAIEYVIIVLQVVRGKASHFNYETPFDELLYQIMTGSIATLWVCTLAITVVLFRAPIEEAASRWAIRLGGAISLVGISLGLLMTRPTATQIAEMDRGVVQNMIGAHSVGVADDGPAMAITGWSTTGGDLRIPHFVGMHALQALPLFLLLLGFLATWFPRLRDGVVRGRLVLVAAAGYAGLVGLVTWQALRGQSLIRPDALTLIVFGLLAGAVTLGALFVLRAPSGETPSRTAPSKDGAGAR